MKDLRLLISLPLLIPIFIGMMLYFIFGLAFMTIGGKKAVQILDSLTEFIKD